MLPEMLFDQPEMSRCRVVQHLPAHMHEFEVCKVGEASGRDRSAEATIARRWVFDNFWS